MIVDTHAVLRRQKQGRARRWSIADARLFWTKPYPDTHVCRSSPQPPVRPIRSTADEAQCRDVSDLICEERRGICLGWPI
jgi:hypothetical protein